MARPTILDKDSIGLEVLNGVETFHVIASLMDGETVIATRMIQGCADVADAQEKADDEFSKVDADALPEPAKLKHDKDSSNARIDAIKATMDGKPVVVKVAEIR